MFINKKGVLQKTYKTKSGIGCPRNDHASGTGHGQFGGQHHGWRIGRSF